MFFFFNFVLNTTLNSPMIKVFITNINKKEILLFGRDS